MGKIQAGEGIWGHNTNFFLACPLSSDAETVWLSFQPLRGTLSLRMDGLFNFFFSVF
jgi:hypothetical protein